jgi:two-component system, NtrC family, response regulator GlrR
MASDDEIDVSELVDSRRAATELLGAPRPVSVRRFRVTAVAGPASGKSAESSGDRMAIGSHPSNDFVLDDPAVSRFHSEITVGARGPWLADLGSSNGTLLDGVPLGEGGLREGSLIKVGHSTLSFQLGAEHNLLPISDKNALGTLVGQSVAMRTAFALLERAAQSDATVLIEGETGTGKEGAAESIHRGSARAEQPFIVVDCSAMPAALLESELFGHEKGAFTGATSRRIGAFEEADKGTVFLDEVGELPPDLQPKLLRVLERREIRRLGTNQHKSVSVRLIAATNRDLRAQVNRGEFRADLYFRIAVVKIPLPPLRERLDDIPLLTEHFISTLGLAPAQAAPLRDAAFLARLAHAAWPGNVRELRNHIERCVVLGQELPVEGAEPHAAGGFEIDPHRSYSEAKRAVLDEFERRYLEGLLALHGGNVSKAARAAGMDRVHLYKLLHRHGLRG